MFRASNSFLQKLTQKKLNLTKTLAATLALALFVITSLSLSSVFADGTVNWDGSQGLTNGVPTTDCTGDTAQPGSLLWVFTATGADSATITINGQTFTMVQSGQGSGSFKYVQTGFDGNFSALTVSATYVGTTNGNTQLTISHGCPAQLAKVTLTKSFAQGPFTTLPVSGDACFTLAPAAGSSLTTQCSNTPEWDGLPTGDYTVSETTTPAGYATMTAIVFHVRTDCTGVSGTCVTTGNTTAFELGPVTNQLLPGHLRVVKLLGPGLTTWVGPSVSFYVCANSPASSSTEQTPATCNSSTAVQTLAVPPSPADSGNLAEGYYTVCEGTLAGYTVNDQCQVAQVFAGSVASANTLTFVNTPIQYWCSPGFWATALSQNRTAVLNYLAANTTPSLNLKTTFYSAIPSSLHPATLKKGTPSTVTLAQVLLSPSTYGGPAFNSVADYIAAQLGWGGTQLTGESCPLNAQGVFTPQVSIL